VSYLACEAHGRMLLRGDGFWECAGFDGEGIGWCTAGPVPPSAAERLFSCLTYWPGVLVVNESGQVAGRRSARSQLAGQVREAVNQMLRRGPIA
jgi:hypothetical protein